MPLPVPVKLIPVYVTVVAVATSFVLYVPAAVPVKLTASTLYGFPSLALPVPAASVASNVLPSVTIAFTVPSYILLDGTLKPEIVKAFCVIIKFIVPEPLHGSPVLELILPPTK